MSPAQNRNRLTPATPSVQTLRPEPRLPVAARDLLDIGGLDGKEILAILDRAGEFCRRRVSSALPLQGRVVGLFFFQSSTRTRLGFHAAAARLGATAVEVGSTRYDLGMSAAETALDTFRSVASYCDAIVLRHGSEAEFLQMVATAEVPVINGGCGMRHHPTQTLVDLYYIRSHFGRLDGLRIGIAGDLSRSRAAQSLLDSLKHLGISKLRLMAPSNRQALAAILPSLPCGSVEFLSHLDPSDLDVLYMAGFPEGSGSDRAPWEVRSALRLTTEHARSLPETSLILDPLPRIDEVEREVDDLPQAAYFDQSRCGQYVRMAILERSLICHLTAMEAAPPRVHP